MGSQLERRRINNDPRRALKLYRKMKNEGFGTIPTRRDLAQRILDEQLAERAYF